jgi:hypothetical protein
MEKKILDASIFVTNKCKSKKFDSLSWSNYFEEKDYVLVDHVSRCEWYSVFDSEGESLIRRYEEVIEGNNFIITSIANIYLNLYYYCNRSNKI